MSSSHIDNKKKDILVLRKGPTQGLVHTLTAEKMHCINSTVTRKKFYLSLHYNGANIDDIKDTHKYFMKNNYIV